MKNNTKSAIILTVASVIWGCSFAVQEKAAGIGPFALSCMRFSIGGLVLLPVILILRAVARKKGNAHSINLKKTVLGGIICGLCLVTATCLQQTGITLNAADSAGSSGKAGFITSMYILLVPLIRAFAKKKISASVIIGVILASAGLFFISVTGSFTVSSGDLMLICCALVFSFQIIAVDYYINDCDGLIMSCVQFFTVGIVGLMLAICFETTDFAVIGASLMPILYLGVMSSGAAYTLQIIGQKYCTNLTAGSLIMSLESVFAMVTACIVFSKLPTLRELVGCLLMAAAIVIVETPFTDRALHKLIKGRSVA